MRVRDIVAEDVHSIRPDATVSEAAQMMADLNVGALPVVENGRVTGILTDRDILIRVTAQSLEPSSVDVRSVMSPDVIACSPDDTTEDVLAVMERRQIRRMPVVDADGTLAGVVTMGELVQAGSPSTPG